MTRRDFDELPGPDQQPRAVQPGYGSVYRTPQPGSGPAPGNPYAQPPVQAADFVRPPRRGLRGRTGVLVGALAAALLALGGGSYILLRGGSGDAGNAAAPAASASVDQGDGQGPGGPPFVFDPNAGIKQGEGRVWLVSNRTDVPGSGASQYGPWRVGDAAVKAMFKEVTAYTATDGKEKWKLPLATPLCGVPESPAPNGKIVVGVREKDSTTSQCTHLQQVDLATGQAGWKLEIPKEKAFDQALELRLAISGDTVAVARSGVVSGFSVTDGHKLFGTPSTGCTPATVGGATARLMLVRDCFGQNTADRQSMIEEIDPATGAAKWSHPYPKGSNLGQILSVDPLVVSTYDTKEKVWNITAFAADGKVRSQTNAAFGVGKRCNGWGSGSGDLHDCNAAVADADTLYIAGGTPDATYPLDVAKPDEVIAVDLNTGQVKWRTKGPGGRVMFPLAIEEGKVVVYVDTDKGLSAAMAAIPTGGGRPRIFLQSPKIARGPESAFYTSSVRLSWAGGRVFLLNGSVHSPEPRKVDHSLLSFGK
ncbi:PQQ-binding-like beta-propeller repeat protein [Streptomyces sp. G1]|uniref:outer membrane protein assembly factor BamB family protein n=1 Tax=Streptomyces sp. G1 TaxID=361572 RepID=UPI00202F42E5|nr:PQQ-binding-like beta-propeller repeat protein [Streptomyces sp. G1]MCM1969389.1 PQQ-like beta-propeller repeat protein [Streptomyces sp. G1]